MRERLFTFTQLSDFNGLFPALNYTSNTNPSNNQWTFNANKELHVKDSSNTVFGGMQLEYTNLSIGDEIEIKVELMSISGVHPKIAIDGYGGGDNQGLVNTNGYTFTKGSWIPLDIRYIIQKQNTLYRILIGVFTSDIGEYKVRNLTVKIKSKTTSFLFTQRPFEYQSLFTDLNNNYKSTIRKDANGMVHLIVNAKRTDNTDVVADANYTIGTLPIGFRPVQNIRFAIMGESTVPVARWGVGWIDTAGDVNIRAGSAFKNFGFVITFPTF